MRVMLKCQYEFDVALHGIIVKNVALSLSLVGTPDLFYDIIH